MLLRDLEGEDSSAWTSPFLEVCINALIFNAPMHIMHASHWDRSNGKERC